MGARGYARLIWPDGIRASGGGAGTRLIEVSVKPRASGCGFVGGPGVRLFGACADSGWMLLHLHGYACHDLHYADG